MEFLNKLNLKPMVILKFFGVVFAGLLILALMFQILNSAFRSVGTFSDKGGRYVTDGMNFSQEAAFSDSFSGAPGISKLSLKNVASVMPRQNNVNMGDDSEAFEVTEHRATIETRRLKETCAVISGLKEKTYVIFENANEYDSACNFSFKVKLDYVDEVLEIIEGLDPKDLSANTHTIKSLVDDYTSETEILLKKKETIESTLENAIRSYDEISRVATQARDAESLSRIIDSKIRIIERLSQERITISEQIDRINRAKAQQLDRLAYTYFNVNVYENKFVDGEQIKDSWKSEVKRSVRELNEIAQNVSINLVTAGFTIFQYLLYIFLLLIALKYFWKLAVYFWKR